MSVEIHGYYPPQFEGLKAVFAKNFEDGEELGARFTFVVEGEVAADLWAGSADRKGTVPFDDRTLTPVFSTTKALASLLIARLVEAGKLSYGQAVSDIWPEFGQAGKEAITVEQVLSHQAGLPGFLEPMEPSAWFDWDGICARLAAMAPMWPPGTASGYHAVTVGYLAGEIFRRVDGRTMGTALREDIAGPLDLDLFIGLPDSEHGRVAELKRPPAMPDFGAPTDPIRAAFLLPWSSPGGRSSADWRRMEIPSANGHATAQALARLFGALATDGELEGRHILSPATRDLATAERIAGQDKVLPFKVSWGAGFLRNPPNHFYGPTDSAFGHSGWGGACAFADPERGVGGAYVMNRQGVDLMGDPRSLRLIAAAYAAL